MVPTDRHLIRLQTSVKHQFVTIMGVFLQGATGFGEYRRLSGDFVPTKVKVITGKSEPNV